MTILFTLDHELYFGDYPGTVENCMIRPVEQLLHTTNAFAIPYTFFVDAGYLVKLKKFKREYPQLESEMEKLHKQLGMLVDNGHDIQLHIHPHWEDTWHDGKDWVMNTNRYKLSDFNKDQVESIVSQYKSTLEEISGQTTVAYRAGGWCIQPFSHIKNALSKQGITVDSTVFPNGFYHSANQYFDFRQCPQKNTWQFEDNPCQEKTNGSFLEVPIASKQLSQWFFWKLALTKLQKNEKHENFGDGRPVKSSKTELLRMMAFPSTSVVSMDGYKAAFMEKAFQKWKTHYGNNGYFVVIGHPKAMTPFSLNKVKEFIERHHKHHRFSTLRQEFS